MTTSEQLPGTDPSGLQTLEDLAAARQFNRWMFDVIRPWCKGHVLEAGSGIGNLSAVFLEQQLTLTTSDLREEYCQVLQEKFGNHPYFNGVVAMDLSIPDFDTRHASLLQQFDTVVALNVIEHIENDQLAIRNCRSLLQPGGQMVILVPAYQSLYNSFDKELGHFVRYTKDRLQQLLKGQHLEIIHASYFNAAGILGWAMNGSLLKKKTIPRNQLLLFDKLVPVFKLIDSITFHRVGLSVIAIGRKAS